MEFICIMVQVYFNSFFRYFLRFTHLKIHRLIIWLLRDWISVAFVFDLRIWIPFYFSLSAQNCGFLSKRPASIWVLQHCIRLELNNLSLIGMKIIWLLAYYILYRFSIRRFIGSLTIGEHLILTELLFFRFGCLLKIVIII